MELSTIRNKLEQLKGKKEQVIQNISDIDARITEGEKHLRKLEKVREIIKQVGLETQSQISYNISNISSMAMEAVLKNPYELDIDFLERRNKTECDITFKRGGIKIDPYDGGGGAVDVGAFALRVASWSMALNKSRAVLILDEPFKHLKGEETNVRMLEMVKEISDKIGLQIIMVSDERVDRSITLQYADRLFEVEIKNGISQINVEK